MVDDARLEAEESVTFAATAGGAAVGSAVLTVADDDRAVLAVDRAGGPGRPRAGRPSRSSCAWSRHPDNGGPPIADDACFLDFPVTAALSVTGNGAELSGTPALPAEYTFPATAFDDCTREVTVDLATRASDGTWAADRTVAFALAPKAGQDARIDPGDGSVKVRDDTPVPGPLVTGIAVSPVPPEASEDYPRARNKAAFEAVPDRAVHGRGAVLTFTLTFDQDVTVTRDSETRARPELALDVFGRERRADYTGPVGTPTRTMAFRWMVKLGDYDPDGLGVRRIVLNGATIRDAQGRATPPGSFPAEAFKAHRVRGGFFEMRLVVNGRGARGRALPGGGPPDRRVRRACGGLRAGDRQRRPRPRHRKADEGDAVRGRTPCREEPGRPRRRLANEGSTRCRCRATAGRTRGAR